MSIDKPPSPGLNAPNFAALFEEWTWRSIPNCPGRYCLVGSQPALERLLGEGVQVRIQSCARAKDRVAIAEFPDGGLISYLRDDGSLLHTLNTPAGFERKLRDLGLQTNAVV